MLQMTWLRLLRYCSPHRVERDLRPLWEETGAHLQHPDCLRGRVPLAATVLRASHDFYREPSIWMWTKENTKTVILTRTINTTIECNTTYRVIHEK